MGIVSQYTKQSPSLILFLEAKYNHSFVISKVPVYILFEKGFIINCFRHTRLTSQQSLFSLHSTLDIPTTKSTTEKTTQAEPISTVVDIAISEAPTTKETTKGNLLIFELK